MRLLLHKLYNTDVGVGVFFDSIYFDNLKSVNIRDIQLFPTLYFVGLLLPEAKFVPLVGLFLVCF